jgi:hypothetical protein
LCFGSMGERERSGAEHQRHDGKKFHPVHVTRPTPMVLVMRAKPPRPARYSFYTGGAVSLLTTPPASTLRRIRP